MTVKDRFRKLDVVVSALKGAGVAPAIIVSQFDPDAFGSARGLQWLLEERWGVTSTIYYGGAIGHPQNRALLNRFDPGERMKPLSRLQLTAQVPIALVDSSMIRDARLQLDPALMNVKIVVDHHRGSTVVETDESMVWVDTVGAAATMMIELIQASGAKLTEEHRDIATALALGIYTDTKALVAGSSRDRRAYGWVSRLVSPTELAELLEYSLSESHFRNLAMALNGMARRGSRLVAGLGTLPDRDGDDLSTIADYLIRMDGITLAVTWGILGKRVRLSARNRDITVALDTFLKERFGADSVGAKLAPDGRGEGGGLLTLDLGWLASEGNREQIIAAVKARIEELIFNG